MLKMFVYLSDNKVFNYSYFILKLWDIWRVLNQRLRGRIKTHLPPFLRIVSAPYGLQDLSGGINQKRK